jgi:hypothetical protein
MMDFQRTSSGLYVPPALVGLEKKSRPDQIEEAIKEAARAVMYNDSTLPVLVNGKTVAVVRGRNYPDRRVEISRDKMWCGFTTYDSIINAITQGQKFRADWIKANTTAPVAANWYDMWPVGGMPAVGTYTGTASASRSLTDADVGAMAHGGNVSTATKHLLNVALNSSGGTPTVMLYDRVLTYEAVPFNAAAANTFTNTNTAQRYASAGTSGMKIAVTAQTVLGATASNITTLTYVNQAGTASRTMPTTITQVVTVSAAAPTATLGARFVATAAGQFLPFQAGDSGARSITNLTTSAANTGTLCFVLARPLCIIPTQAALSTTLMDTVMQVAGLERIFDGACLSFFTLFPTATATTLVGAVEAGWN